MKGLLVIIDGLGDLPHYQLGGKTPLQIANKSNLDFISKHSKLGFMYPVKENVVPESDTAVLSVLGNKMMKDTRGPLESVGAGLKTMRGDLAIRTNFATISGKHIIDRRVGRTLTTYEATQLAKAINNNVKLPCKFIFKNTIQHRGVLVLKGAFSDNITNTDPEYHGKTKMVLKPQFKFSEPLDEDENSKYTADLVNEFIEQSHKILKEHPINKARVKKGFYPANILITRDAGVKVPEIKQFKKWAAVVAMPLEIGIAKTSGMDVFSFDYPQMKDFDVYRNLHIGLEVTCDNAVRFIKSNFKKYNYIYVHLKETDVPGHDNKPFEKIKMIEQIDRSFFSKIVDFLKNNKINVIVTADHSTPCKLKSHSADPVPVLFCDWKSEGKVFDEETCKGGELGKIMGVDLLKKVGFVK